MDLLRTLLLYMTLLYTSSVQSMPDVEEVLAAMVTPTPPVVENTKPAPTQSPTPVPTVEVSVNPEYQMLVMGSKGEEVTRLQESLKSYGYYEGDVDGRYGNQTRRAVEKFQYQHGLSVDGIAGRATLSVLYDSGVVRPAPTPDKTPAAETAPAPEDDVKPTLVPPQEPSQSPTDVPAPTDLPAPTSEPPFEAMKGWVIQVEGQSGPLAAIVGDKGETAPILPYAYGDIVYVPLLQVLENAGVLVIPSDETDPGYAFAFGDKVYRLSYDLDQRGDPYNLEITLGGERQLVPVRDIRLADGLIYLPCEAITSVTGIAFETGDQQILLVKLPAAE